jgi:hypothetical protein
LNSTAYIVREAWNMNNAMACDIHATLLILVIIANEWFENLLQYQTRQFATALILHNQWIIYKRLACEDGQLL